IANFELGVYSAQENVTRAENALKTLILGNRSAAEWAKAIVPVSPVDLETPKATLDQSVEEALRSRPEISQLETAKDINQIEKRYFRDQLK
ncbi:hypothetical protein OFC55_33285, partial [Escherichia coli]|nr:hypothetical protein [Escherichia coli]